jgi:hypothetical protein
MGHHDTDPGPLSDFAAAVTFGSIVILMNMSKTKGLNTKMEIDSFFGSKPVPSDTNEHGSFRPAFIGSLLLLCQHDPVPSTALRGRSNRNCGSRWSMA